MHILGPEEIERAVLWAGVSNFSAKGKKNSETCDAHHWTGGRKWWLWPLTFSATGR
jgi:hypothetical protein